MLIGGLGHDSFKRRLGKITEHETMFKNHEPEGPQLHSALKEIKAAIEVVEIVQCFETMEGEPDTIRSWHLLDVTEGLDFPPS